MGDGPHQTCFGLSQQLTNSVHLCAIEQFVLAVHENIDDDRVVLFIGLYVFLQHGPLVEDAKESRSDRAYN